MVGGVHMDMDTALWLLVALRVWGPSPREEGETPSLHTHTLLPWQRVSSSAPPPHHHLGAGASRLTYVKCLTNHHWVSRFTQAPSTQAQGACVGS
eukprot:scaffold186574_cov24-Tisochrysis_lutea.AAC.1